MTLLEKQKMFMVNLGKFLVWLAANNHEVTGGELQRTEAQAEINAKSGVGISNSLHKKCLAIDLKLFNGGVYQTDSLPYTGAGAYWKSLHPLNRWGGDFKKQDGGHFSMEHEGVK